jgi:hypothetical protein
MGDMTNAAGAIAIANSDGLLALVAALAASGAIDPKVFREKIRSIQDSNSGADVMNKEYYDRTISNLIGASEGYL